MKSLTKLGITALFSAFALTLAGQSQAAEEYLITIKDHKFEPAELKVPAGEKIKLVVHNQDSTPEEFESHDLRREKIVQAGKKITLTVGPLAAGNYKYVGEFNEESAKGTIIAE